MESLVQMFQMLKYGIAAILILIGFKLIFCGYLTMSSTVCFAMIVAILAASIASSYWIPRCRENCERIDLGTMGSIAEAGEEEFESEFVTGGRAARGAGRGTASREYRRDHELGEEFERREV